MAGTIICDYIRTDANQLSLNVGNTTFATINARGLLSNTGVTIIAANGVISGAGTISKSALPAGSVLQVVQGITTTEVTSSLATYVNTGLSASITPTSSSSKILVMVTHGTITKSNGLSTNRVMLKLLRDSTDLYVFGNGLLYTATALQNRGSASFTYLDSPATTSSVTYKTQVANGDAAAEVQVQTNGSASTITLMEIAV